MHIINTECPECEGHGDADWDKEEAYYVPCDRCGGRGVVVLNQPFPEQTEDFDEIILPIVLDI